MSDKGFRDGQKEKLMKEIQKTMTPAEAARIKEQREFDSIEEGTFSYELALHLDQLRQAMRDEQGQIDKMLHNISLLNNSIARCEDEIRTGDIKQKLDNDLVMNKKELLTHIAHEKWLKLNEVRAIARAVQKIRGYVGHKDVGGKMIMTKEQYADYVVDVRKGLEERGHDIFD